MKSKFMAISAIIAGLAIISIVSFSYSGQQSETIETLNISYDELERQTGSESDFVIIDIRDSNSYMLGHIEGSTIDGLNQEKILEKRIGTINSRIPEVIDDTKFVIVDDDGSSSKAVAQTMIESGLEAYHLQGGIQSWKNPMVAKDSPTTITSDDLWKTIKNNENDDDDDVYLLDVRQPEELDVTKITGSVNITLEEIFESKKIGMIPDDKPVVVICGSGNRATIATYELAKYEIDFQVLEGGIKSWDAYLGENSLDKI